jgi:hypothetical protein
MLPLGKQLVRSYYGAYVVQAPILIALALLLHGVTVASEWKTLIVVPLGIAGSFIAAYYFVKLPGVNKVL